MSWTAIILWALMHLGDIRNIIKEIANLIHKAPDAEVQRRVISTAIQTGDSKKARKAFMDFHQECVGAGCVKGAGATG